MSLVVISVKLALFNPYLANVPILYHLKIPENLWFSGVFRGYKMGSLARNGLKKSQCREHVFLLQ